MVHSLRRLGLLVGLFINQKKTLNLKTPAFSLQYGRFAHNLRKMRGLRTTLLCIVWYNTTRICSFVVHQIQKYSLMAGTLLVCVLSNMRPLWCSSLEMVQLQRPFAGLSSSTARVLWTFLVIGKRPLDFPPSTFLIDFHCLLDFCR